MPDRRHTLDQPQIALVGPWILNKGDDLMFRSVLEHFGDVPIAAPRELWPAGVPEELFSQVLPPHAGEFRHAMRVRDPIMMARLAAKRVLISLAPDLGPRLVGSASASRLTTLLDCSGFGYGDTWPPERMLRRHGYYRRLRRRGVNIVFLPQALGPFKSHAARNAARQLFASSDMIFARDASSYEHLRSLELPEAVQLRQCPDISHLLAGRPPADASVWQQRVCIVPNMRMLDRTPAEQAAAYLDFLATTANAVQTEGYEPWIIVHEANDVELVEVLNSRLPEPLPVVDVDAVATKGILGASRAAVASRYHALVSCLSQATPVIGTSWSHKYDQLFEEYGHGDYLIAPNADPALVRSRLREVIGGPARGRITSRLAEVATEAKQSVSDMWRDVDALIAVAPVASVKLV